MRKTRDELRFCVDVKRITKSRYTIIILFYDDSSLKIRVKITKYESTPHLEPITEADCWKYDSLPEDTQEFIESMLLG